MQINNLIKQTSKLNWQEKLIFISDNFQNIVFSTSFSIEDQLILDFIVESSVMHFE